MERIFKKGEVATAILLFSLLAMGIGSLIGVREIQKGTTNTTSSQAQTTCKYKSEVHIIDSQGNPVVHPDLKVEWAHYRPQGTDFDFTAPVRKGITPLPNGKTDLGDTGVELDAKSKDALAQITLPQSSLYTVVGWDCKDNTSTQGCRGTQNRTGENKVQIVMHCGGDNSYDFVVDPLFTIIPTDAVTVTPSPTRIPPTPTIQASPTVPPNCTFASTATIKDQNGQIDATGKTSGFSVGYKFTNNAGKVYSGDSYFTKGEIKTPEAPLRADIINQKVTLTLNYNKAEYDLVGPTCTDGNSNKSCSDWLNETVIVKYSCGAKNNYGWILKQKPKTAQLGIFTPGRDHQCAVSVDNTDYKVNVHHLMHNDIKCDEQYDKATDTMHVKFKIKEGNEVNMGETAVLFRTSRCDGIQGTCDEPILRQLRLRRESVDTLDKGKVAECWWKHPFSLTSDTPECTFRQNPAVIPPRPQLTGTVDSIIMKKGDATYIYSKAQNGCTRAYTGGAGTCKAEGLSCDTSTTTSNGKTLYGAVLKIEDSNATGLVQVGEYKGCPCNEDGICDGNHRNIPGTNTPAQTYKNRALYDSCLGDDKSKISCYIDGPSPCTKGGNGYGSCKNMSVAHGTGDKNVQLDINRSYWTKANIGACMTAGDDHGTCPAGYKCSASGSSVTIQKVCGQSSQRIYIERFYDCACNPSGQCREDLGGKYNKLFDSNLEDGISCDVNGNCQNIGNTCSGNQPGNPQPTTPPPSQICSGQNASCRETYTEACGNGGTRTCTKIGKCSAAGGGDKCSWGAGSCCSVCSDGSTDGATCRTGGPGNPGNPTPRPQQPIQPTPTTAPSCSTGSAFEKCMCTCQVGGDTLAVCAQECSPQIPACDCINDGAGYNQCNTGCALYGTTGNQCSTRQSCMRTEPTSTPPQGGCPAGQCRYVYGDTDECTAMTSTYTYCGDRVDCPLGQGVTRSIYGINSDGSCKIEQTSCRDSNYCGNNTPPTSRCPSGQCRFVWGDINECRPTTTNQTFCGERANCSVGQGVTVSIYGTKADGTCSVEYTNCRDSNYCGNNYNTPIPTQPPTGECSCIPSEFGQGRGGCSQGCIPESWLGGNRTGYCSSSNRCYRSSDNYPPVRQAPQGLSPNGSQIYTNLDGSRLGGTTLSWSPVSGATGYELEIISKCSLNPVNNPQTVRASGNSYTISSFSSCDFNAYPVLVYWKVRALYSGADVPYGPQSGEANFKVSPEQSRRACDDDKCLFDYRNQYKCLATGTIQLCTSLNSCPSGRRTAHLGGTLGGARCDTPYPGECISSVGYCLDWTTGEIRMSKQESTKTNNISTTNITDSDVDKNGIVDVKDALLAIQEIREKGTLHGKKITGYAQAISQILGSLGQSVKK